MIEVRVTKGIRERVRFSEGSTAKTFGVQGVTSALRAKVRQLQIKIKIDPFVSRQRSQSSFSHISASTVLYAPQEYFLDLLERTAWYIKC